MTYTRIVLERIGRTPMPLDIVITYDDGSQELIYVPQTLMRWSKPNETSLKRTEKEGWDWAYPTFELTLQKEKLKIKSIVIDPSALMADVNRENNSYLKRMKV